MPPPNIVTRARPALTGRAMVLGVLMVLLVVVLASPVSRFLGSRGDVAKAGQQLRQDQTQLTELSRQKSLYSDPGYIQQQARTRLQFAMPGDTVFVVVDKGAKTELAQTSGPAGDGRAGGPAWTSRLWNSVREAQR